MDLERVEDPLGKFVFFTAAYWDEQDKRVAIAQIMRLADVQEVNSWSEPPLEPEFGKTTRPLNRVKDAETDASDAHCRRVKCSRYCQHSRVVAVVWR